MFEGYDVKVRLDKTDAHYVDVIHSNGESLIVGGLGVWEPIGHVDFYPNGGRAQSGCQHLLIGGLYDFIYCKNIKLFQKSTEKYYLYSSCAIAFCPSVCTNTRNRKDQARKELSNVMVHSLLF